MNKYNSSGHNILKRLSKGVGTMNFRAVVFCVAVLTYFTPITGCSTVHEQDTSPQKLSNGDFLAAAELAYKPYSKNEIGKNITNLKGMNKPIPTEVTKRLADYHLAAFSTYNRRFNGVALKNNKDNSLLFSFSGYQQINLQEIYQRLINFNTQENLQTPIVVDDQAQEAYKWVKTILNKKENKDAKVYVTGHSFGGYLAQYIAYNLQNDKKMKENHPVIQGVTFNSLGLLLDNGSKKQHIKVEMIQKNYKSIFTNYIINGDPLDYANKTFFKDITGNTLKSLGEVQYITSDENYKTALSQLEKTSDLWTRAQRLKPLYPYHNLIKFESKFW